MRFYKENGINANMAFTCSLCPRPGQNIIHVKDLMDHLRSAHGKLKKDPERRNKSSTSPRLSEMVLNPGAFESNLRRLESKFYSKPTRSPEGSRSSQRWETEKSDTQETPNNANMDFTCSRTERRNKSSSSTRKSDHQMVLRSARRHRFNPGAFDSRPDSRPLDSRASQRWETETLIGPRDLVRCRECANTKVLFKNLEKHRKKCHRW